MIARLRGRVAAVDADRAIIEVGGLGLAVNASARDLARLAGSVGKEAQLSTYLHVREDTLQLYGFAEERDRALFLVLIGVAGVGPKVALAVLSGYPAQELELAVARGDAKKFESIPGVGKKLAQRLIVELKDSAGIDIPQGAARPASAAGPAAFMQARSALQNLGLSLREAEAALNGAPAEADVQELVKHALRRARESE
jgi:holliday junction DNA helicase RuvA